MRRSLSRVAVLVAASASVLIASQQPPTFVAGNKTVAVYATVTNARGRLEPDLKQEDFGSLKPGSQTYHYRYRIEVFDVRKWNASAKQLMRIITSSSRKIF